MPNHCWYRGEKFDCGLSLSCVFAGEKPLDLCDGGMVWSCCVPKARVNDLDDDFGSGDFDLSGFATPFNSSKLDPYLFCGCLESYRIIPERPGSEGGFGDFPTRPPRPPRASRPGFSRPRHPSEDYHFGEDEHDDDDDDYHFDHHDGGGGGGKHRFGGSHSEKKSLL